MQLQKLNTRLLTIIAAGVLGVFTAAAQYKLPGQHTELIASVDNNNAAKMVSQDIQSFVDSNFEEESEPEGDIYTEGWNSKRVNAYVGVDVPDSKVIDVSDYAMPTPGYITSPYGYRRRFGRMHKGVDLKCHIGDTIRAAFDGKVRLTNYEARGYGKYVIVRHDNGLETVYGHLSGFLVEPDDIVKAGDPIALGGNTGRSTGPHLHFETRFMGYPINPLAIFDFANQTTHTDYYTFTKTTYQDARNFDPNANAEYAAQYRRDNPAKSSGSSSGRAKTSSYKIKKGDTLSKIASRNGTTVRRLCKLNGLKTTSKLRVGQSIRLR